ncbi:MAG: universal stress protein [Deferrisomatales bacterium]|nr:universal stress protein [Deferrisomatales bacterium]
MKKIRKILFPTKFEDLSFPCIERLYPLKGAGLEEIIFLFVIDREEVAGDLFRGFDKQLVEQFREEARLRFEDWEKEVAASGVRCRHLVEIGRPEGKILEISCREEVDLIASGRQRHVASDSLYLGGTAMGLLRRSGIPVFVCKHGTEGVCTPVGGHDFERVLFATDFSENAGHALEFVKSLAGVAQKVGVVHVIAEREFKKSSVEQIHSEEEQSRKQLDAICAELAELGLDAVPHLLAGEIHSQILQTAADHRASLIVMGTKGRHGLKEIWLGSSSHRVAELSTVPVILVPMERDECYI